MNRGRAAFGLAAATSLVALGGGGPSLGCQESVLVELLEPNTICPSGTDCGTPCVDDSACPLGLYCSPGGDCTFDCTPAGSLCGTNLTCTDRGRCVPTDQIDPPDTHVGGTAEISGEELEALRQSSCSQWDDRDPRPSATSLMFVVDVSRSMETAVADGGTRWSVTRDALVEMLDSLPDDAEVGLLLFPNGEGTEGFGDRSDPVEAACINIERLVALADLDDGQRNRLLNALWRADLSDEERPTAHAYSFAYDAMDGPTENTHMVVITDGEPTFRLECTDSATSSTSPTGALISAIQAARGESTSTFVVGTPGSADVRAWLATAALEGGTRRGECSTSVPPYCHFDMVEEPAFAAGLERALETISSQGVCDYWMQSPPLGSIDYDTTTVVWTKSDGTRRVLLRDDANDCAGEGWQYITGQSEIRLCPESCEAVREDTNDRLDFFYDCVIVS